MIKALILDVDGVLIGDKHGFNFPMPHPEVMIRLKNIRASGIPISLCTAKPHYSVEKIIDEGKLNNIHITMAGGVIIDPIDNIVLANHFMDSRRAKKLLKTYLDNNIYTEIYSLNNYYIQSNQVRELTALHTAILQKVPIIVNSLIDEINRHKIVKIMPIAKNRQDQKKLNSLFSEHQQHLVLSWGYHPSAAPHMFANITAKGISKKQATSEVAKSLKISESEILGVGDSLADWQFIELCGYGGAMGNADQELKNNIRIKGTKSFIGKSVDDNGILNILDHFGLKK